MAEVPEIIGVKIAPGEATKGLLRDVPAFMEIRFQDGHIETWDAIVKPKSYWEVTGVTP